jgi:hypothetical protein
VASGSDSHSAFYAGLLIGIGANAVWALLVVGGRRILSGTESFSPKRRQLWVLGILIATAVVLGLSLLALIEWHYSAGWGWALVILGCAWAVFVVLRELSQFWNVGVLGADREISKGLSYGPALTLVKTDMSFLGTGAYKLTKCVEFEPALRRCRSDVPIRLLLREPTDPTLVAAESRAGRPAGEYSKNVIESLRTIARLQDSIGNISVRFYKGDLVFRILLINRRIALVSFNMYGKGDGSQLPQLHLVDVSEKHEIDDSFFHAYEKYFNEHWETAKVWDFLEHI